MSAPNFVFPYSPTSTPSTIPAISPTLPQPLDPDMALRSLSHQSSDFFFSDGSLNLQAENVHYRVHTYLFERHSKAFVDKFITRAAGSKVVILDDVRSHDLDQLLSVLYPLDFQEHTPATVAQWSAVLSLATKWEFSSIRQLAIEKLTCLAESADKVALGRAHGVDRWLLSAYVDLCDRCEPLTMDEGEKLDKADIIRIMRVRHEIKNPATKIDIISRVAEAFGLEAPKVKVKSARYPSLPPSVKKMGPMPTSPNTKCEKARPVTPPVCEVPCEAPRPETPVKSEYAVCSSPQPSAFPSDMKGCEPYMLPAPICEEAKEPEDLGTRKGKCRKTSLQMPW